MRFSIIRLISNNHIIAIFLFPDLRIPEMFPAEMFRHHISCYNRILRKLSICFSVSNRKALVLIYVFYSIFFLLCHTGIYKQMSFFCLNGRS